MYDSSMVTTDRHFTKDKSLDPSRPALLLIDVQPRRTEARMNCPHWLLALSIRPEPSFGQPGTKTGCRGGCPVAPLKRNSESQKPVRAIHSCFGTSGLYVN